jgi:aspartyl-tRNA(Asn)/glutamyl-tRNA(Gln) amidotransferase subunit B
MMDHGDPYEAVIGLEVHAQVITASKMFCGCSANYAGSLPNTHVCPTCLGLPGALPVINRSAVEKTILTALCLGCRFPEQSKFDRKNYSYPDLPKGYQISQYDMPLALDGLLEYPVTGHLRQCGIIRVHLEEDTGKTSHVSQDGREISLVDYNRSGIPLMEIVGAPQLSSGEAARAFFATLRQTLMYLDVNDGNLQEGKMRADVNISVRDADGHLGTKVEVKNLNSFRAVQRAIEFETIRQRELLSAGRQVEQETRGWSERDEITLGQRSKEYAEDYRYFPEPDLPPLHVGSVWSTSLRRHLPELPLARAKRFVETYGLSESTADVLTLERATADFFEETVASTQATPATEAAKWVTGDIMRLVHESDTTLGESQLTPSALAALLELRQDGTVSGAAVKTALEAMFLTGEDAETVIRRLNLSQIGDEAALVALVVKVIAENPDMVAAYRKGKTNVLQALVGQVMSASAGRANPPKAKALLEEKLQTLP